LYNKLFICINNHTILDRQLEMINETNYEKVLNIFFDDPTGRFYIREIARQTGLNPNTIINITQRLEEEGIVKREKKKYVVELFANLEGGNFKELKRLANFKRIYFSGIIKFLNDKFSSEAISIIGSYSRGEDVKKSDIDIVVISKKEYSSVNLTKFEKILNRKMHLVVTDYSKISDEFYINLINGILLYGFINKK